MVHDAHATLPAMKKGFIGTLAKQRTNAGSFSETGELLTAQSCQCQAADGKELTSKMAS